MKNFKTPRGTQDILLDDVYKWQHVEDLIRQICTVYNYDEIRTPVFEDTGVFKRENDSSDMVNKEMYTFSINNVDSITLRPEGTAGVVRSVVQNKLYGSQELPLKLYYVGEMFRYERPQKGRFRQFNQFGIENIGLKSPLVDAEVIALGYSLVKSLGLSEIKVLINTLGDLESRNAYKGVLKSHFADEISSMCDDCKRRYEQNPLRLLDCKVDKDHPAMKSVPSLNESLNEQSKQYFTQVLSTLENLGIPYEIDDKLVRGLDYYTDTVFEVVSTHPDSGSQATVFAGGRYDNLIEYFGGPELSGVGFALGLERLLILAEAEKIELGSKPELDVYVMALGEVGDIPLNLATLCRANGFITDCNLQSRSLKSQFKTVDRKRAKAVLIVGEEELKNNQVNIKHIESKTQVCVNIDEIISTLDSMLYEEDDHHTCGDDCCCKGE